MGVNPESLCNYSLGYVSWALGATGGLVLPINPAAGAGIAAAAGASL